MSHKIPCEIIRDLMPLYVDGLTSEATDWEVKGHLEECEPCRLVYERMKQEVKGEGAAPQEGGNGIDYLKKVRKRNIRNVVAGAAAVFLVMTAALVVKLFILGYPTDSYIVTYTNINDNRVQTGGTFYGSAAVFSRYKLVPGADGTDELVVYACLPSFWNRSGTFNLDMALPADGRQMDLNGITVKGDGTIISKLANELYQARNPYIGDASADGKLAGIAGIGRTLGSYKNELQTTSEPYGWTLNFEDSVANSAVFEEKMKTYSCLLIALTGNLGQVTWNYTVESAEGQLQRSGTMTENQCSDYAGAPIKSFAESPEEVQKLCELLGISG